MSGRGKQGTAPTLCALTPKTTPKADTPARPQIGQCRDIDLFFRILQLINFMTYDNQRPCPPGSTCAYKHPFRAGGLARDQMLVEEPLGWRWYDRSLPWSHRPLCSFLTSCLDSSFRYTLVSWISVRIPPSNQPTGAF